MHIVGARSPIAGGVDNGGLATLGSVFVAGGDVGDGSVPVGLDNLGNLADSIAGGVNPFTAGLCSFNFAESVKARLKL